MSAVIAMVTNKIPLMGVVYLTRVMSTVRPQPHGHPGLEGPGGPQGPGASVREEAAHTKWGH